MNISNKSTALGLAKTIQVNAFSGDEMQGSRQCLHFVDRLADVGSLPMTLHAGIDYSSAFVDLEHARVVVRWQNHQDNIQFCGSAAYALSYYLLRQFELESLSIESPHIQLTAFKDSKTVKLRIPARKIQPAAKQIVTWGHLYRHRQSGIYFLEADSLRHLQQLNWKATDFYALPLDDPHGLCVFYWDTDCHTGFLRYFTPWHGRAEDSVTGSVQCYLNPFIAERYQRDNQLWYQLSQAGGKILSAMKKGSVEMNGYCEQGYQKQHP